MKLSNNKILITGGATGIGLGLTERFLRLNNTVIICGRREDVLKQAMEKLPGVITRVCDLSVESERISLYNWIREMHPDLNVLINNAGIQQVMKITDDDFYSRARQEIAINIEAPIHLTSMFVKLPSLTTILNVTSGLSFAPLVIVPVYSATKAFFHSFSLSLQKLLIKKNIEVIEIIPPAVNTDLGGKGRHDFAPPVSEFIESIFTQLEKGGTALTFGSSAFMLNASAEEVKKVFEKMNEAE